MSDKRVDYITWDEYFMGVAALSGRRSKDPSTGGAMHRKARTTRSFYGYNGFPKGCSDDEISMGQGA